MNEIEKKYKLASNVDESVLEKSAFLKESFIQTYFTDDDGIDKRLRIHYNSIDLSKNTKIKDRAVICVKQLIDIVDGVEVRDEKEDPIELSIAKNIVMNNLKTTLLKDRLYIKNNEYVFEVDTYTNSLKVDTDMVGDKNILKTVEVEVKDLNDLNNFLKLPLPTWVGSDVTLDKRYSNKALACGEKTSDEIETVVKNYCGIKSNKNKI